MKKNVNFLNKFFKIDFPLKIARRSMMAVVKLDLLYRFSLRKILWKNNQVKFLKISSHHIARACISIVC